MLAARAAAKTTVGVSRVKPSVRPSAVAQTDSRTPETTRTSQYTVHSRSAVLSLSGYGAARPGALGGSGLSVSHGREADRDARGLPGVLDEGDQPAAGVDGGVQTRGAGRGDPPAVDEGRRLRGGDRPRREDRRRGVGELERARSPAGDQRGGGVFDRCG